MPKKLSDVKGNKNILGANSYEVYLVLVEKRVLTQANKKGH